MYHNDFNPFIHLLLKGDDAENQDAAVSWWRDHPVEAESWRVGLHSIFSFIVHMVNQWRS